MHTYGPPLLVLSAAVGAKNLHTLFVGDLAVRVLQRQHVGPAVDLLHALPLPLHRRVQVGQSSVHFTD